MFIKDSSAGGSDLYPVHKVNMLKKKKVFFADSLQLSLGVNFNQGENKKVYRQKWGQMGGFTSLAKENTRSS